MEDTAQETGAFADLPGKAFTSRHFQARMHAPTRYQHLHSPSHPSITAPVKDLCFDIVAAQDSCLLGGEVGQTLAIMHDPISTRDQYKYHQMFSCIASVPWYWFEIEF